MWRPVGEPHETAAEKNQGVSRERAYQPEQKSRIVSMNSRTYSQICSTITKANQTTQGAKNSFFSSKSNTIHRTMEVTVLPPSFDYWNEKHVFDSLSTTTTITTTKPFSPKQVVVG
jgi:hypothetical protein